MKLLVLAIILLLSFFSVSQKSVYSDTSNPEYDIAIMNYSDLNQIEKFKKVEFGIDLSNVAIPLDIESRIERFLRNPKDSSKHAMNPFLEWELDIVAIFEHKRTGEVKRRSFFYYHQFERNNSKTDWNDLNESNNHIMRVRFAPPALGEWEATVIIKDHGVIKHNLPKFRFNVIDNDHPGYVTVHPNNRNYQRGNKIIYPLGHTFPGPYNGVDIWGWKKKGRPTNKTASPDDYVEYMKDIEAYAAAGGKYIKTAQCAYSNLIEFEELGNYHNRMHYAWEQDILLDYCEDKDLLMNFDLLFQDVIFRYGQSGSGGDFDGWGACKGGYEPVPWDYGHEGPRGEHNPCDNTPTYCYYKEGTLPGSMFLDDDRMVYHKQRTRYYISRYGYSPQIYMFELMSEPYHMNANLAHEPITEVDHPDHDVTMEALNVYHNEISEYIKQEMGHRDHLLCIQMYELNKPKIYYSSAENVNIDIIGHNPYRGEPDKLIQERSSGNALKIKSAEVSRYKEIEDFKKRHDLYKPVVLTEAGSAIQYNPCSKHINHYTDVMTLGFSGYAGLHIWNGYQHPRENSTGEPETRFLWKSTIRAEKHMNSEDIIDVLSAGNGNWSQGRQISKNQLKGMQYYLSADGNSAVGYVKNRTFNHHTMLVDSTNCYNQVYPTFLNRTDLKWDDPGSVMKVKGLNRGASYTTDYTGYEKGNYRSQDCKKVKLTNTYKLQHPELLMELPSIQKDGIQPILWFVISESGCGN
ncbi:MAG: hypothetical protein MK105_01430 [Crocinitomicaceae bacterium]|nr:hypothetical protein [Crocinitomicaceae bacterium]